MTSTMTGEVVPHAGHRSPPRASVPGDGNHRPASGVASAMSILTPDDIALLDEKHLDRLCFDLGVRGGLICHGAGSSALVRAGTGWLGNALAIPSAGSTRS